MTVFGLFSGVTNACHLCGLYSKTDRFVYLNINVFEWLTSFVTGRTYQVAFNGQLSPVQPVLYGVPQLFVLYTAELSQVVAQHRLMLHQYADDCQIYEMMTCRHPVFI